MAALTKEQKAQRGAEKQAGQSGPVNISGQEQEQEQNMLIAMFTDFEPFPGAPKNADVHPDEVENFKADGWRITE